jgi:PTH1 family peptidyl-tRNA hydrolase
MRLIIGLGNPGEKYERTHHNIGFMIVDELARKWKLSWKTNKERVTQEARKGTGGAEVLLVKPQTMMNASGFAVAKLVRNLGKLGEVGDLWIIHDELDLPLGKIKIARGRGSAGHHGIDSIIRELGTTDFVRFRIGIGHPARGGVEDFVLSDFRGKEAVEAKKAVKKAVAAILVALEKGPEKAMARYN